MTNLKDHLRFMEKEVMLGHEDGGEQVGQLAKVLQYKDSETGEWVDVPLVDAEGNPA